MSDEEYPCDPGYCQILELHEHIKALTAENKRLGQQCEGLMQAGMNNGQALIIAETKLAKAVEALRDLTNAFAKKVDVDQTRWKTPYEPPLSAYDRAVAFLKGNKR